MTKPKYIGSALDQNTDRFVVGMLREIDPALLIPNPENERTLTIDEDFARSIEEHGILQALQVFADGTVHEGNRRLFHIQWLREQGRKAPEVVPIVIVPRDEDETTRVIKRLNVNQSEQFPPLDQGVALAKLRDAGMNNAQIAKATPFSAMHVGVMLYLHDLSQEVKDAVRADIVSANMAVDVAKAHGELVLLRAIELAEAEGKRVRSKHVEAADAELNPPQVETAPAAPAAQPQASTQVEISDDDSVPFDVDDDRNDPGPLPSVSELLETTEVEVTPDAQDVDVEEVEILPQDNAQPVTPVTPASAVTPAAPAASTPASSDPYKLNEKTARAMIGMFLPAANRFLEIEDAQESPTPEDIDAFMQALRGFVIECENYNIAPVEGI